MGSKPRKGAFALVALEQNFAVAATAAHPAVALKVGGNGCESLVVDNEAGYDGGRFPPSSLSVEDDVEALLALLFERRGGLVYLGDCFTGLWHFDVKSVA